MRHSTVDPAAIHDPEHYPLRVGQRVYDHRDLADPSVSQPAAMIVLDAPATDIYETTFEADGEEQTLAEYTPNARYADYALSTRVVTIVWTSWLDAHVADWRDHLPADDTGPSCEDETGSDSSNATHSNHLIGHLHEYERAWGVSIFDGDHLYDYPESRLVPAEVVE